MDSISPNKKLMLRVTTAQSPSTEEISKTETFIGCENKKAKFEKGLLFKSGFDLTLQLE
jgi:hypothetical protein